MGLGGVPARSASAPLPHVDTWRRRHAPFSASRPAIGCRRQEVSQPRGRSLPARPITASPPGGPGLMGDSEGRDLPRGRANRGRACLPATQSRKATEERHPMSGGGGRGWRSGRARRSPRLGPSRPRSAAMAAVGDDGSGVGSSIGLLLEAAEYLERREREAEHGYASLLPGAGRARRESPRRRGKGRRSGGGGRSTHNEMEKNRRAHLRLCLEKLKVLVPLGPESSKHTTLSLLMKAKLHIKKLEDYDRRALHQIEQLQREQRHLKRQLEKLGSERVRTDSVGSAVSSERSDSDREEIDVDVESTDSLPADLDWSSSSPSDSDERGSLQSVCSDEGYASSGVRRAKAQSAHKLCPAL